MSRLGSGLLSVGRDGGEERVIIMRHATHSRVWRRRVFGRNIDSQPLLAPPLHPFTTSCPYFAPVLSSFTTNRLCFIPCLHLYPVSLPVLHVFLPLLNCPW